MLVDLKQVFILETSFSESSPFLCGLCVNIGYGQVERREPGTGTWRKIFG